MVPQGLGGKSSSLCAQASDLLLQTGEPSILPSHRGCCHTAEVTASPSVAEDLEGEISVQVLRERTRNTVDSLAVI